MCEEQSWNSQSMSESEMRERDVHHFTVHRVQSSFEPKQRQTNYGFRREREMWFGIILAGYHYQNRSLIGETERVFVLCGFSTVHTDHCSKAFV